ncbi:MAG: hypothetical protein JWO19_5894 [Bryobacterales bacterium]|nr:hypothetical protein [Candidatus Acidoferrum typicum]MCU1340313.1 hypothetical protein [Bryobacterales bacterium]
MSPNAGYWEKELKEATDSLKKLEQEQDQMNPLVYEDLRQKLEVEIKVLAAQLELAHQKEAN